MLTIRLLCMCAPARQEEFLVLAGDPVGSRAAASPVLGKDERAERVNAQRQSRPNTEPSRYCEGLCSAGASLGRANAELVKLNAAVLLRSVPKLLPLARRGALH
jgi:hypothetical protein